jgi:hypothetical protein
MRTTVLSFIISHNQTYIQVLLLAALIGNTELHADNSIALGKGLFNLIAKKTLPQQAIPSKALICETFCYRYGEVAADKLEVNCTREYFFRPRACFSAWRHGKIKELNCLVGNHPMEDVIHIHAWVQLHYMHMGKLPSHFYFMPGMVPRSAELVPGRIYPFVSHSGEFGVIQLCPGGRSFAVLCMGDYHPQAICIESWQSHVMELKIQVAPLVYRMGAVIRDPDGHLRVLSPQVTVELPPQVQGFVPKFESRVHLNAPLINYLNYDGNYTLSDGSEVHWTQAHSSLVALGAHVVVRKDIVQRGLSNTKVPHGNHTHVKGWLRYRDECDPAGTTDSIYIAFRVASQNNEMEDVCVLPIDEEHCSLAEDMPDVACVDYLEIK